MTKPTGVHHDPAVAEGRMFLVDKPAEWSSFDVVNKMRGILHIKKIGHAGTLDRLATGLLIVCTGRKTKELSSFQDLGKEYEVTFRLGETTETYDAESEVLEKKCLEHLSADMISQVVGSFVGEQSQLPPMWSAAKVKGKRLYKYARKGVEVQRRSRRITVYDIRVSSIHLPDVTMTVSCSKGTYVRTLIHDIGQRLGVGAHVLGLRRTRIGPYSVGEAMSINDLMRLKQTEQKQPA